MPPVQNLRTNVLLRSEQTGGHVAVTEIVVPPHTAGPPLHTHAFDEVFYLLEGELIFQVEDELLTKMAGELSFAPPATYATRWRITATSARATCSSAASSATGRALRRRRPEPRCRSGRWSRSRR
jgi:hypothetical protein